MDVSCSVFTRNAHTSQSLLELLRRTDVEVDVNARNDAGLTPLHTILKRGRKDKAEILTTLLANSSAKINQMDDKGDTPLHYAVRVRTYVRNI